MSSAHATPSEIAAYRATAQRRMTEQRQQLRDRRARAWDVAREAAALLQQEYGAQRVLLFGSLARGDTVSIHSDVDLAAWGVAEREYYRIVAQLQDLDPSMPVDLVLMEDANARLVHSVEEEGIPL